MDNLNKLGIGRADIGKIFIVMDGKDIGECLLSSEWSRAVFYYPLSHGQIAVNVTVTGTKTQYRHSAGWRRIKITFVHDDEPDTWTGGWILERDIPALHLAQSVHETRCRLEPLDLFQCFSTKEIIDKTLRDANS